MKASVQSLAVLGGPPAFPQGLRFVNPSPPSPDAWLPELRQIHRTGVLTNYGPFVQRFESEIARRLDVRHCVVTANATLGLILALRAWDLGQGEVVVPSFTFSATVHAIVWNGLTPVFADIDPATLTLDPAAVEQALSPRTRAIVAVTIFGVPPDLEPLERLARRHGVRLLVDTAQGLGTSYAGRLLGGFGDAEVLSFHAAKILPIGEGGAVVTNDAATAEWVRLACNFGNPGSGDCRFPGLNAKLSEWAALVGLKGLETLEETLRRRRELLEVYGRSLAGVPGVTMPRPPREDCVLNGQNCGIRIAAERFGLTRDQLDTVLLSEGAQCKRYFDPPVHRMAAYRGVGRRMVLAHTDRAATETLCLPLHNRLEPDEVERVCGVITLAHREAAEVRAGLEKRISRT